MAQSKKPRKSYRPKHAGDAVLARTQPWRLGTEFGMVGEMLRYLQREGTLDATPSGELIYQSHTGRAYEAVMLVRSATRVFRILRLRDARCPGIEALESLVEQLETDHVDETSVAAALHCFEALHAYALTKPITDIADALQTAAIGVQLEKN
ncbi:hypothetical protein [Ralstonia solanacearum]|uniref:hypothetical protein n=1 Tax=Ralstonia solanacearum TaxID=305 RepID=UPI0012D4B95F|nr:hypothetical protein [Ralstonia solanacearum]MDC6179734.1 hypothetical protein [Ralstonia solanacearum]MDC6239612.1 hypothetical protein [Ralstonia solanacearum]